MKRRDSATAGLLVRSAAVWAKLLPADPPGLRWAASALRAFGTSVLASRDMLTEAEWDFLRAIAAGEIDDPPLQPDHARRILNAYQDRA